MKTATSTEIATELTKSIVQHGCSNQRYRQLARRLSQEDPALVGDALLGYWATEIREEDEYWPQKFVAALLFVLNPPTTLALGEILAGLKKWNLSVQEFPWYLALQFGEERLLHELEVLGQESPGDVALVQAVETMRYWLRKGYRAARAGDEMGFGL
jgi:hypothetical protein